MDLAADVSCVLHLAVLRLLIDRARATKIWISKETIMTLHRATLILAAAALAIAALTDVSAALTASQRAAILGSKPSGGGGGGSSGSVLLVDGSSFLLQVDGASRICIAGGC